MESNRTLQCHVIFYKYSRVRKGSCEVFVEPFELSHYATLCAGRTCLLHVLCLIWTGFEKETFIREHSWREYEFVQMLRVREFRVKLSVSSRRNYNYSSDVSFVQFHHNIKGWTSILKFDDNTYCITIFLYATLHVTECNLLDTILFFLINISCNRSGKFLRDFLPRW